MGELSILRDLVVIFAVGVVVVAMLRRIGVPSIAGFIVAGILVGPHASRLISDAHQVETLAEIGVVLLLFGIGLELSLERLRRLWRPILIGGALQVGITILATLALAGVLGRPVLAGGTVFLGFLVAVSSTAIVLRGLEARGELDAPSGRFTLGILVFQDLCVVPMMLVIPLLSGGMQSAGTAVIALLKATAVVAGVLIAARVIVPRVLHWAARTRQRDLFVLTVLLVCIGTAWAVSSAGVSLALGAFLAGLVVAGSQYRHQALSDLIPLREVLASLFFVSVGMLLDPLGLLRNAGPVLGIFAAIVIGKFSIVLAVGLLMRLPLRVCVLAAVALAQVGEFSFVLTRAAQGTGLLEGALATNLSAAVILSMLATPFLLALGPHIAAAALRIRPFTRLLETRTPVGSLESEKPHHDHVIIAGYGIAGQELANSLTQCGIPYIVLDLNADNVQEVARAGGSAYYGDVTSTDVLAHLGAAQARELVLVINDSGAVERGVRAARRIAPKLPILVRAPYVADIESLLNSGATDVVPAELEAAAEITRRVLARHEIDPAIIDEHVARIRRRRSDDDPHAPSTDK